jgi:hypothetical protein
MASSTSSGSVSQSGSSPRRSRVSVAAHRPPPCWRTNTTRHHASATCPSGRRSRLCRRYPAPRQVAARSGCGRCRAAPHGLARPAPKGLGRLPTRPRSPRLLVVRTGLSAHQCDTGAMDEERLPSREERARLSDSRLETHQHRSPAGATCCQSLLLDPDAMIGIDLRKRLFLLVTRRGE